MSLLVRILLTIMAAMGWCYRAQAATDVEGAPKGVRYGVMAAEHFYLSHLRSCVASATGEHHTGKGAAPCLWISSERVLMDVLEPIASSASTGRMSQAIPASQLGAVAIGGDMVIRCFVCSLVGAN